MSPQVEVDIASTIRFSHLSKEQLMKLCLDQTSHDLIFKTDQLYRQAMLALCRKMSDEVEL